MKCLVTYETIEQAYEKRSFLAGMGIPVTIAVDPMESIYPALCSFTGVAIMVKPAHYAMALNAINSKNFHKAG